VRRFFRNPPNGLKEFAARADRDSNRRARRGRGEEPMAIRPLVFGARLRQSERTLRVRCHDRDARRYVVEDSDAGRATCRRDHVSLEGALRDAARTWRARLH